MNPAIDPRLIARLSTEFTSLGEHLNILGRDLDTLHTQVLAETMRTAAQTATGTGVAGAGSSEAPSTVSVTERRTDQGVPGTLDEVAAAEQGGLPVQGTVPTGQEVLAWSAPGSGPAGAAPIWGQSPVGVPGWPAQQGVPTPGAPGAGPAAGWGQPPSSGIGMPGVPGAPIPPASGWIPPSGPMGMPGAQPVPGPVGAAGPGWAGPGAQPLSPMPGLPQQRRVVAGRPVREPWWQREGVISRVLAVAGVAVTLIGVVMLLVLAAQAGFFGPVPRVVAGGLFSAALVGVGARVFAEPGGRVGGIALAATGIAGGYLDVVAMTTMYRWLDPIVGYVVAFGIAAGGMALAMRWNSQGLAVLVTAGAAVLAPFVSTELMLLVGFLIVLQIAALPVQLVRDWPWLHVIRTIPAVLVTLLAVVGTALDAGAGPDRYQALAAAIVIAVTGLAGAVLAGRLRAGDVTASLSFGAATVPMLAAPVLFSGRTGPTVVAGAVAAVLLLVAAVPWVPKLGAAARIPGHLAAVSALAGAVALLEACVGVTEVRTLPTALFVVAMGFLAVAGQQRSRFAAALGAAYGGLGALVFLFRADPATLAGQAEAEAHLGISTALSAVFLLAVLAVAAWTARRLGLLDRESDATVLSVFAGIGGLYAVTALTVSLGVATGSRDGFLAGHGIATVIWMAAATAALLFGLRRLSRRSPQAKVALVAGLLLTGAALAKLFLFDLATLAGLLRAAAFLVVGVLLLMVGTRYARAFADLNART
ncbi:DUF2339 domain-containing protein [Nocardia sp. NPDC004151]|uniref:DUF2339 domain-containing protein n=1 Tax=Nocardia sp. NPDC004151 TaxID=3364304 RepID=UPI0036A9FBDF